jgi:hypothetical protein
MSYIIAFTRVALLVKISLRHLVFPMRLGLLASSLLRMINVGYIYPLKKLPAVLHAISRSSVSFCVQIFRMHQCMLGLILFLSI